MRTRPRSRPFVIVAAVVVVLALAAWALTTSLSGDTPTGQVPAADSADAGFARDMAVHHQQAVEMSYIVRDQTDDEDARRLAYDIAQTQANQRGMLFGWLDLWELPKISADGYMTWMKDQKHGEHQAKDGTLMPGMATADELEQLGKLKGRQAEILYLQLMTDHHMGGVTMARACAQQCAVKTEKRLAQGMVDAQQSEMKLMAGMLKERGSAAR
ncbi:DUF305 domain-containing protein [Streptomyces phaeochromogenes]|uniref:DUF305 domain-containing protein n=1 Tax=Streptomyces phaeochromogenes TaxID=1923 RepID=UPI00224CFC4F|nr:DUF305 domain-containing protein [Streptomyces phaeochromogenes]MCX5601220.1 DUF305 domain-containing protein [Streptomyces phaeochromogenes]